MLIFFIINWNFWIYEATNFTTFYSKIRRNRSTSIPISLYYWSYIILLFNNRLFGFRLGKILNKGGEGKVVRNLKNGNVVRSRKKWRKKSWRRRTPDWTGRSPRSSYRSRCSRNMRGAALPSQWRSLTGSLGALQTWSRRWCDVTDAVVKWNWIKVQPECL